MTAPVARIRWPLFVMLFATSCGATTTGPSSDILDAASPLGASVGRLAPDELERAAFEDEQLVQERAAECMGKLGFQYTAIVTLVPRPSPPSPESELGAEQFAATYGYGISTLARPPPEIPEDPNASLLATMTPDEVRAYNIALVGYDISDVEALGVRESGEGCDGEARRSVQPADMPGEDQLDAYFALVNEISDRIDADPRVLAAAEGWRACMGDAGFGAFDDTGDAKLSIYEEWDSVLGENSSPDLAVLEVVAGLGPELVSAAVGPGVFEAVRRLEIETATADAGCSRGFEAVLDEVRRVVERDAVELNWPLLVAVAPAIR